MAFTAWATAVAILGLLLLLVLWALYELARQQGRLVLRLDELERRLNQAAGGLPGASDEGLPAPISVAVRRVERVGLAAGTPAPAFTLPDLEGREVSLEEYRGRKVLLVFTGPLCGPCEALLPHLARLHREHRNNGLAVVMVGRGDREDHRRTAEAHALEFPVVLQTRWELSREYGAFAAPVAFLIAEDGIIERAMAQGIEQILSLVPERVATGGRV